MYLCFSNNLQEYHFFFWAEYQKKGTLHVKSSRITNTTTGTRVGYKTTKYMHGDVRKQWIVTWNKTANRITQLTIVILTLVQFIMGAQTRVNLRAVSAQTRVNPRAVRTNTYILFKKVLKTNYLL